MNQLKKPRSPRGAGKNINGDYKRLPVAVSQDIYDEIARLAEIYYRSPSYQGRKPRGNGTALFAKKMILRGMKELKESAISTGT